MWWVLRGMSTEKPEPTEQQGSDQEAMAEGYVPDSQLPEDLRPDENPLAANPEESGDAEQSGGGDAEQPADADESDRDD